MKVLKAFGHLHCTEDRDFCNAFGQSLALLGYEIEAILFVELIA